MIIGILFLGLILRLINLSQSLWLDEAVQAITSQGSFAGIFTELQGDFHPPLYHLLMWLWVHLFGSSEIILRLPSVIFGTATVYVVYLIGKVISDLWLVADGKNKQNQSPTTSHQPLPLLGALFLATAPFHIYYSQEARMYAMTTFFASLSMYYFLRVVSGQCLVIRNKNKPSTTSHQPLVIGYILSITLLLYSDYFGFLVLLAQIIRGMVVLRKKIVRLFPYFIVPLLLWLFWLPMLRMQFQAGLQATQALPEWGRLVNVNFLKALPLTFIKFSIGRITIFNKKLYAAVAGVLFLIYGGIIGKAIGDQYLVTRKKKPTTNYQPLTTIFFWLLIPILSAWFISLFIPNYQPFRLLLVVPAFYLLLTYGISKFSVKMIQIILTIFILGVNLGVLGVYFSCPYFHRENWRGVVEYIEGQAGESLAILPSETSNWPWRYYSSGKVKAIGVSPGVREVTREDFNRLAMKQLSHETIYYIRYLTPLFDRQEKISLWFADNGFVKIREVSFNQIPVWEYRREIGVRRWE